MIRFLQSFFIARTLWGQCLKTVVALGAIVLFINGGFVVLGGLCIHGYIVLAERAAARGVARHGLKADYTIDGRGETWVIDKTKRIILRAQADDTITLIKFSDIRSWDWHWLDSNGSKTKNYIAFNVNDEKNPIIKLHLKNSTVAEEWNQRFELILSA